ncbi:homoserine dehydrogenase [Alkalibacillus salilacus]|uniref:Homoserine dehydrogenase n=1 Tax=Alkalibacillus salilacus TaxID=284582 RepID=A0ABT9VEN1_9BACI|nr:homoserine dehydrogenase [Alkalibacillus salilacus]MDQ0159433.1 homoserine dehydrogenase [Alkalibacillus salilacus]
MEPIRVAILGFGTVGKGVYAHIKEEQQSLEQTLNRPVQVTAVLVNDESKHRDVANHVLLTTNMDDVLAQQIDIVVEAITGVESAYQYVTAAIEQGCHVVTANKAMYAARGQKLQELAEERRINVKYDASVAGGIPIIDTLNQIHQLESVHRIEAILNGTSNYILTAVAKEGLTFHEALTQATRLGYAEADPSHDIDGFDALNKAYILANLLRKDYQEITVNRRKGLDQLQLDEVLNKQTNQVLKPLVTIDATSESAIEIVVEPTWVEENHPLSSVDGVQNAIVISSDRLGSLKLEGAGAGEKPTAHAIVQDIVKTVKEDNRILV